MPNRGRTEMLSTDPGSKFRGASFLKNKSTFCFIIWWVPWHIFKLSNNTWTNLNFEHDCFCTFPFQLDFCSRLFIFVVQQFELKLHRIYRHSFFRRLLFCVIKLSLGRDLNVFYARKLHFDQNWVSWIGEISFSLELSKTFAHRFWSFS